MDSGVAAYANGSSHRSSSMSRDNLVHLLLAALTAEPGQLKVMIN